jgi:ubiquinone biosynthesis protein COQ4
MPDGSLGRAYLRFVEEAGFTADGLADVSGDHVAGDEVDVYIGDRLRDAHDLWHVVAGYQTDLIGEAALLAFTLAQTGGAGIGLLVAVALSRADDPDVRRLMVDGWLRGVRAAWLPAVRWEALLRTDLDEVRHRLRLGRPRHYQPFHAHELPEGGLLSPA